MCGLVYSLQDIGLTRARGLCPEDFDNEIMIILDGEFVTLDREQVCSPTVQTVVRYPFLV